MKTTMTLLTALALVGLTACGDKPQGMGGIRSDAAPYTGVGASKYAEPGWKQGDKTAWEQQLRARSQGQNDYSRAN
jgi:hypothetical protein